jgi:hypothetical protein
MRSDPLSTTFHPSIKGSAYVTPAFNTSNSAWLTLMAYRPACLPLPLTPAFHHHAAPPRPAKREPSHPWGSSESKADNPLSAARRRQSGVHKPRRGHGDR